MSEYGDCIKEVELASFTLLVFSTTGGMGNEAIEFYRQLADHLSRHSSTSYSQILASIRYTLSFSLLRSAGVASMFRGPCLNYFLVAGVIQLSSTYQLVLGVVGKGIPGKKHKSE